MMLVGVIFRGYNAIINIAKDRAGKDETFAIYQAQLDWLSACISKYNIYLHIIQLSVTHDLFTFGAHMHMQRLVITIDQNGPHSQRNPVLVISGC